MQNFVFQARLRGQNRVFTSPLLLFSKSYGAFCLFTRRNQASQFAAIQTRNKCAGYGKI